jgi:thiol-disulfide isomerase/thioredoxin
LSKKIIAVLVGLGLLAAAFWFWQSGGEPEPSASQPSSTDQSSQTAQPGQTQTSRYSQYEKSKLANEYERHILFFHAPWCPDCRAFKQNLTSNGAIPENIQILEVDYDTATDLKQKHGITIQSTFVEVDSKGNQLAKWVGYYKSEGNSFADIEAGLSGS